MPALQLPCPDRLHGSRRSCAGSQVRFFNLVDVNSKTLEASTCDWTVFVEQVRTSHIVSVIELARPRLPQPDLPPCPPPACPAPCRPLALPCAPVLLLPCPCPYLALPLPLSGLIFIRFS